MNKLKVAQIVKSISETHTYDKDELYALNTSDILEGRLLHPELKSIEELKGQFKKKIKKNDILFSEIRPANKRYAKVTWDNAEQYVASTKLMVLRKYNESVDLDYFYYWLTSSYMLNILQKRAENRICSFPQITFDVLCDYYVPIPPLKIQKKIANILKNIDTIVTNNNKIISDLESMAKTIYDYWFLQFEFPNEEGKPYKSSGGKMVWNEELKGEIPEGWKVEYLRDIESNIITGKTPSTNDASNFGHEIPFITIGDIRGHMFIVHTEQSLSKKGADTQANKYIPKESICVSCIASPGLIGFSTRQSQTNQQINSIVCAKSFNKFYLYFALSDYFKFSSGAKTGNTFKNMNKNDFESIQLTYPNFQVLKAFETQTEAFRKEIFGLCEENQELISLRDFLLPLLMNGQVGLREVTK